jgi:hypothetical protein
MIPRQYRCIRRLEAGGMHRLIFQDFKLAKISEARRPLSMD